MKYGFVRLKNDDGSYLYLDPASYDRYSKYPVFNKHADALVVYDKIYIGCFPLLFRVSEILDFNDDAVVINELPASDICFLKSSFSDVARSLGCQNNSL